MLVRNTASFYIFPTYEIIIMSDVFRVGKGLDEKVIEQFTRYCRRGAKSPVAVIENLIRNFVDDLEEMGK
jgi:hypothetical protein